MAEPCRMILDTDPGIDDAMAILFALRRPGIRLEALTTVFGNTDVDTATVNALRILELAGRSEIPVARGASRSLLRPFTKAADHVHGTNGLGGIELPEPRSRPVSETASDLIIRMARENPGEITLCPVGPITNVAVALTRAPEIAGLLREIVVMGSTIFQPGIQGIPTPLADANFWNDPEAAQIVLRSGARITLVGMDVTMKVLLTAPMSEAIARDGGPLGRTLDGDRSLLHDFLRDDVSGHRRLRDARPARGRNRRRPLARENRAHVRRYRARRYIDARHDSRRSTAHRCLAPERRCLSGCRRRAVHRALHQRVSAIPGNVA